MSVELKSLKKVELISMFSLLFVMLLVMILPPSTNWLNTTIIKK
jgi:hypothetical protein